MKVVKMNFKFCLSLLGGLILLVSCSKKAQSNTTGMNYNDPKHGGFQVIDKYQPKTPPGMVFIQGGKITIGQNLEILANKNDNQKRTVTASSFYMDEYEITNINWREYVSWLSVVYHNTPEVVDVARPDSTVWRGELVFNEPYVRYYHSHAAYGHYPVVGVSWNQANDYCAWRTDRINEMELVNAGVIKMTDFEAIRKCSAKAIIEAELNAGNILSGAQRDSIRLAMQDSINRTYVFSMQKYLLMKSYNPELGRRPQLNAFGDTIKTTLSHGLVFPEVRLPTETEWEYAAYGMLPNEEGFFAENKAYPWAGQQMRNPSKKIRGEMQANYTRGRGDLIEHVESLSDRGSITAPVYAFMPNDYGLYNMAGNVNEWVDDVYRETSAWEVEEYNAYRGNMILAPSKDSMDYTIDEYGRLAYDIEKDLRDFRDGDAKSSFDREDWKKRETDTLMLIRYKKKDPLFLLSTDVDNNSRVYKGGSWRDRAYWLNPATRRYLDASKSANDIGFRCAMTKIGESKPIERK